MSLWSLGLPIIYIQQDGWYTFSLSTAKALLVGLTLLGLALRNQRPLEFQRSGILISCLLGIFGYGFSYSSNHCGIGPCHFWINRHPVQPQDDWLTSIHPCCFFPFRED